MRSILISSGNQESRQLKAKEIALEQSSQFDTKVFDTTESRGIEVARSVVTEASHKPINSRVTSIIILEASKLTKEAQNALLKLLEEPVATVQIILTAESRDTLLPTVSSRLTEVNLSMEILSNESRTLWENLAQKTLSEKINLLETSRREDYILFWENILKDLVAKGNNKIRIVHRYNKLLLKMVKAEKSLVNKKLIELILALEVPKI